MVRGCFGAAPGTAGWTFSSFSAANTASFWSGPAAGSSKARFCASSFSASTKRTSGWGRGRRLARVPALRPLGAAGRQVFQQGMGDGEFPAVIVSRMVAMILPPVLVDGRGARAPEQKDARGPFQTWITVAKDFWRGLGAGPSRAHRSYPLQHMREALGTFCWAASGDRRSCPGRRAMARPAPVGTCHPESAPGGMAPDVPVARPPTVGDR